MHELMRRTRPQGVRARPGFTLVELLITLVMMTFIGAAIVSVFGSQQRVLRATGDVGEMRTQLQTATSIIPVELRGISASQGDILSMSDSSIFVRTTIATSIACAGVPGGNVVTLAPTGLLSTVNAQSVRLTAITLDPAPTDSVFIWDDGASGASNDDVWTSAAGGPYIISDTVTTVGACTPPYSNNATLAAKVLTLSTPLRASFLRGSPVRVVRGVRYGIYQSAVDNQWYLGYRDRTFGSYQYVAGPFIAYQSGAAAEKGLRFRYYDNTNTEITNYALTTSVARVEMTLRAKSARELSLGGGTDGKYQQDSLKISISIRNRN